MLNGGSQPKPLTQLFQNDRKTQTGRLKAPFPPTGQSLPSTCNKLGKDRNIVKVLLYLRYFKNSQFFSHNILHYFLDDFLLKGFACTKNFPTITMLLFWKGDLCLRNLSTEIFLFLLYILVTIPAIKTVGLQKYKGLSLSMILWHRACQVTDNGQDELFSQFAMCTKTGTDWKPKVTKKVGQWELCMRAWASIKDISLISWIGRIKSQIN